MIKSVLGLALAGAVAAGLSFASVGAANAEGPKKPFVGKPGPKVIVGHSGPRHSNRGRNIGLGIGAAVVGTIIASEVARANSGGGMSCRALERRCDDGQNWACRRLDQRDDC